MLKYTVFYHVFSSYEEGRPTGPGKTRCLAVILLFLNHKAKGWIVCLLAEENHGESPSPIARGDETFFGAFKGWEVGHFSGDLVKDQIFQDRL